MDSESPTQRMLIGSRAEYLAAADALYGMAQHALCIFDPDLEMLGLNSAERIERLQHFLQRGQENLLRIALHDPSNILRAYPRLVELMRRFAPRVPVFRTEGVAARAQDCFVLADARHFVRRAVAQQARGVHALHEDGEGRLLHERFEEIWAASAEAVSPSTLGL